MVKATVYAVLIWLALSLVGEAQNRVYFPFVAQETTASCEVRLGLLEARVQQLEHNQAKIIAIIGPTPVVE